MKRDIEKILNQEKSFELRLADFEVKEGDKVLFGKYAGTEIKIDGEENLIMREDDIIAIVE